MLDLQILSVNLDGSLWWFLPIITDWLHKIVNKHIVVITFAKTAVYTNIYEKSLCTDMSCWLRYPPWMGLILRKLEVRTNTPEKKFSAQTSSFSLTKQFYQFGHVHQHLLAIYDGYYLLCSALNQLDVFSCLAVIS